MLDERLQFIEECKSQEWSTAEVCQRFEISRKTGYKWLGRYKTGGVDALQDGSHAPHSNPRRVREKVEDAIVGRVLIGEPVGLEPCGDGLWKLWFSSYELGVFDERKLLIRAPRKPAAKAAK